jgi:hypothetical protein
MGLFTVGPRHAAPSKPGFSSSAIDRLSRRHLARYKAQWRLLSLEFFWAACAGPLNSIRRTAPGALRRLGSTCFGENVFSAADLIVVVSSTSKLAVGNPDMVSKTSVSSIIMWGVALHKRHPVWLVNCYQGGTPRKPFPGTLQVHWELKACMVERTVGQFASRVPFLLYLDP